MPLYLYGCGDGHRSEALRPVGTESIPCPECGAPTRRVYGYSLALTQPEPDTRGMFRRFSEASQELEHRGYRGPNLWQRAKRRAEAMVEAGEHPAGRS